MKEYQSFLESKKMSDPSTGMVDTPEISSHLFPYQRDIVKWALHRGRAAVFADCGLGKTVIQLEWARIVHEHTSHPVLILAPLAVAEQTAEEGSRFGVDVTICRTSDDVRGGINITNYERLHHFNPAQFAGVVLDESSILKSHSGKTRTAIIDGFAETPWRLACTATPSPNDHMELGNHAEFLGAMTRAEMLAMFFVHEGSRTSQWRLKGHGIDDFWRWVSSWACMMRSPSDLGYSDDGFVLPELRVHDVIISNVAPTDGMLFAMAAESLRERQIARKETIEQRVGHIADMVKSKGGRWILWCDYNAESAALTSAIDGAVEITGSDNLDVKTARLNAFSNGEFDVLVTKPSIAGFGLNWQHCHQMAFCGLSDSYEKFYQAVRRCWRFGQREPVDVHIVTTTRSASVLRNIKRKAADHDEMAANMAAHVAVHHEVTAMSHDKSEYAREVASGPAWDVHLGDCVDVVSEIETGIIDYTIFSPPFASLYTYSNSDRDMGNCKTTDEFVEHFKFLVAELLRVTRPGRLLSFHCMNLPTSKMRDGVIGLRDFRGELIKVFCDVGWIYHSEVCIWKDPVTAMQRTKALGLLYKQLRKDSAMSRQGIADYLVTVRAPGANDSPITHTHDSFPVELWQRYASPVWMDIDQSRTLNRTEAREEDDERHICPLQLDVIERAIDLWSKPDDLVLSPFTGIGSEGVVAVKKGRRFIGAELKRAYWEQARKNMEEADRESLQVDIMELLEVG